MVCIAHGKPTEYNYIAFFVRHVNAGRKTDWESLEENGRFRPKLGMVLGVFRRNVNPGIVVLLKPTTLN